MTAPLARRGIVEGFYGAPWTHAERLGALRFSAEVGFDEYLYAPKDDPFHRERWREPYPSDDLARIGELAAQGERLGVRATVAIAPGLDMRFADAADSAALAAKAAQLWDAGVRRFSLLFDDIPLELRDPQDVAEFGAGPRGAGRAHGAVCARFVAQVLAPRGIDEPLLMCPTDYAGTEPTPYRDGLAETLPPDALVLWTGHDIVVGEVTREQVDAAAAAYQRALVLWDNFPVNDFDRTRLFLGPLLGRTSALEPAPGAAAPPLVGVLANPMVEALPSRFALAAVADWARDPAGYVPEVAAESALQRVAGDRAETLRALVAACSSWPPGAPRSPRLAALAEAALDRDARAGAAALGELEAEFAALAATASGGVQTELERVMRPWIEAAQATGRAGVLACRVLDAVLAAERGGGGGAVHVAAADRAALRDALGEAESQFADVLRTLVTDLAREVLVRAGDTPTPPSTHRRAVLVTDATPSPGDRDLIERLGALGIQVTRSVDGIVDPSAQDAPELVIVTRRASQTAARAAASVPLPLIGWGRLESLGLASESGALLDVDAIQITAPGHPLAAGLDGRVEVFRGRGKLGWGEPGADAEVVARAESGQPVLVQHPAGATLADDTTAPAPRVALFLTEDGAAPWLLTDAGRALVHAAIHHLLGAPASAPCPDPRAAPHPD